MTQHPNPTARARDLVRGAYDTHLHLWPDAIRRTTSDLELATRFAERGLAGFILKSHYVPTAERAAVVRAAVPGTDVLGSITLNRAVGGLNAIAVEIAAREGAVVVWLPTFDSHNETLGRTSEDLGQALPAWARIQRELRAMGITSEPIDIVGEDGQLVPELLTILRMIAAHDIVLATGHLSRNEIFAVVEAAQKNGVKRIVVTHPEFPSQRIPQADQVELARRGCMLERCLTTPYTGKVGWGEMFANIRAAGIQSSVVSSDLGQLHNPPPEDGLALMADELLKAEFSVSDVQMMIVENSIALARRGVVV